jgi:hypothetical protein
MLLKDYDRKCSVEKEMLAVSLKGLAPRPTDWGQTVSRKVTLTLTQSGVEFESSGVEC